MKLLELFNAIKIQNNQRPANGASAIFEGTNSYSQHALNDMVEDHLPENTRVWKIQWIMSEDGNDGYRPQFIFAKTKDEAAHKFTERMKHPSLGLVAIESIIEIPFNKLNEGEVVPFPTKDKRSDAEKYDDALTGQKLQRMPDDKLDQAIQKQRQELGFSMSDKEAQKYANDIIDDIKNGLRKESNIRAMYDNVNEWLFELLAGDLPYDKHDSNLVVKMILAHPDFDKIHHILKKNHNYDLVSNLTEGEVVPFPAKRKPDMTDRQKYDMATELQRIDREAEWQPDASEDIRIDADPTKEEMQHVMTKYLGAPEVDEFDYAAAMYWFASDFQGGQSSNLYSALSTSQYNPGPMVSKIEDEDEIAQELYFTLYDYFSNINEGDVIQPFPDKMLWSKKARDSWTDKRTDAKKYKDALTKQHGRHRIDWNALKDKRKVDPDIKEAEHPWASKHGARGRNYLDELEIRTLLWDNIDDIRDRLDAGESDKQIAIDYEVTEDDIAKMQDDERWFGDEWGGDDHEYDVDEGKQLKNRKQPKDAAGAWNKAEQYTKYDPPKTKNKGVSARRGFVGG